MVVVVVNHTDSALKCLEIVETLRQDRNLAEVKIQTCDVKDEKNWLKTVVSTVQQALPMQETPIEAVVATVN